MFDKYIDEFIPSKEMREYLKVPHESVDTIAEIIYYAPASIERKRKALTELLKELNSEEEADLIFNTETYLRNIQEAERLLEAEGVFSIEIVEYNENKGESDYEFDGLFNNFNDLVQYVKQSMEECEITDEDLLYYQAVKWINDESGKLVEACTYWIVRGEIWFVQLEGNVLDIDFQDLFMSADVNLPVPFKAGDIVVADFYPFAGKRIIEIIEVGDNRDCCCLQALSMNRDGSFKTGAVKHGHIGDDLLLEISPLYTITAYEDELPSEYKILEAVSNYIDGSEENGRALWDLLSGKTANDGITSEGIQACIDKIRRGKG